MSYYPTGYEEFNKSFSNAKQDFENQQAIKNAALIGAFALILILMLRKR